MYKTLVKIWNKNAHCTHFTNGIAKLYNDWSWNHPFTPGVHKAVLVVLLLPLLVEVPVARTYGIIRDTFGQMEEKRNFFVAQSVIMKESEKSVFDIKRGLDG